MDDNHNDLQQTVEITPLPKDKIRPLKPEEAAQINSHYVPFSAEEAKKNPEYCVDGRTSETTEVYAQALGGSYNVAVTGWLLGDTVDFTSSTTDTFKALREKGYACGVHSDDHGHGCGCGFVNRLEDIINVFKKNDKEIWSRITEAAPALTAQEKTWQEVVGRVLTKDLSSITEGNHALEEATKQGASLQTLKGNHNEIAAYVNTTEGTTLDVAHNQDTQAFNLDLWYVTKQARELGMDETKTNLLTLGLFVATEIVLVEAHGEKRLPIQVR